MLIFRELYAFILQDAAQGFHWSNAQSTLHLNVAYFRESHTSEIDHFDFIVISEYLHHDRVAVSTSAITCKLALE